MDVRNLDAKLPTDSILTKRKICCTMFVVLGLLTFYACYVGVAVELPPAPAEIDQNKTEVNTLNKASIHRNRTIVLIVAYMRTGSTLTGSLFREYSSAFYVFEPLHMLQQAFSRPADDKVTLKYVNGTTRNYLVSERSEVFLDEINSWLNCKIESLSIQTLTCRHHRVFTKVMMAFFYCSQGHFSASISHVDANLERCLRTAISFCKEAQLLAFKFIRLSMEEASKLLPLYPNMKIIHLVRDPRGIIQSKLKIKAVTTKTFKKDVVTYCSRIEKDLKVSKEIPQKHPKRLKILRYEDLAEKPLETAETLFKFLGLTFEKHLQDFIFQQTHASHKSCKYCTQRKNSSKTSNKWRSHIDHNMAIFIYDTCRTSNVILGYLPLESAQALRNLTIPSRRLVHEV
ncbi:carbohydrate sulfotransferase 1-like [Mercenaria mercenaria]|uniref:carbohydrate sulfotransferase 1-like n=1 Tax=Mercenaria mercenaria TaxID=6596 RepID=UPI00234F78D2|nr:carbohydrate sulfotransferase 1-like [Mercenaria mercenaria]